MGGDGQGRDSVGAMKLYSGPLSMFGAKAEIAKAFLTFLQSPTAQAVIKARGLTPG